MIKPLILAIIVASTIQAQAQTGDTADGSRFYALSPGSVQVEVVECPARLQAIKGTWLGDFQAYDRTRKAFRPFKNKTVYDGSCYRNTKNGELFTVGQRTDTYPEYQGLPAKTETSILIIGAASGSDGRPFLRTIDKENGLIEYHKVFEDKATEMSVWEFEPPRKENQPEMRFRIVDFRNILNEKTNERMVVVSLRVGPENQPYWQGIVTKGSHSRTE